MNTYESSSYNDHSSLFSWWGSNGPCTDAVWLGGTCIYGIIPPPNKNASCEAVSLSGVGGLACIYIIYSYDE
eukprot:4961282-Amphidinium_carterae.1